MFLTTPFNILNNFAAPGVFCRTATTHSASFDWDQESESLEVAALPPITTDEQAEDLPATAP